jgi:zinc/manganese transport system ATP-binding protein
VSALTLDQVSIALNGKAILSDVSLAITQGQFIGLLGPNGAGKTTLLRALLGLIRPVSGSIKVLGKPVLRGNPRVGYIPQLRSNVAEMPLRGLDFVALASNGHRWGMPRLSRAEKREVHWAIETVGATALADRPLRELSGGQRQRLLLAQALLGQPQLLLLDEPLISLDPHYQHAVIKLVKQLQIELGITVMFCAHELNPLLSAIDQVLYLGNGQAALGAVNQVITSPVLSRLYGAPIEVIRTHNRIFVMSGEAAAEQQEHSHDACL